MSSKSNYVTWALERFETIVNDKGRSYSDKIEALILAWDQLAFFVDDSVDVSSQPAFETFFLYTLKFVLMIDWKRTSELTKTVLSIHVSKFSKAVSTSRNHLNMRWKCRVLEATVQKPWSNPTLEKILQDEEVDVRALLEYFRLENGTVTAMRLTTLLEKRKYDLVIRLSKSCLTAYQKSTEVELDYNQSELDYIADVYFCTLYKKGMRENLIREIRLYKLDEGLALLRRYRRAGGVVNRSSRVWKCVSQVAELIANTLLADCVVHEKLTDSDAILPELIREWVAIHELDGAQKFSVLTLSMITKLVIAASSSKCIYPFCSFLVENHYYGEEIRAEILRWLMHAITRNINETEHSRVHREHDKLVAAQERLSDGFILLSKLFSDSKHIYRECILTAFSLTPSRQGLQTVEMLSDHPLDQPTQIEVVPAYYRELEDMSGLDEILKVDLHTILRHQRSHMLSWELGWCALAANCLAHLQEIEMRGLSYETELNYLRLDYTQFRDLPINYEDYIQIEKGYEHFLETENLSDMRRDSYDLISLSSGGSSSHDDDDDDEDFVVRKLVTQKRVRRQRFTSSDSSDWENVMKFTDGAQISVHRGKRPAESAANSDDECSSRKSSRLSVIFGDSTTSREIEVIKRTDDSPPEGRAFQICIPRLPNGFVYGASAGSRSPKQGKRLTMRVRLPSQASNKKPRMAETDGSLNSALQSLLESFESSESPETSSQRLLEAESGQEDDVMQQHVAESSRDAARKVSPLIIRRHTVESGGGKRGSRKKRRKLVFYTTAIRPTSRTTDTYHNDFVSSSLPDLNTRLVPRPIDQANESRTAST